MKDGFEFYFILFFVALLWMDGRARREREREKKKVIRRESRKRENETTK